MKKTNYAIELLRIIAIWAVVAIHTTGRTLTTVGFQYSDHAPFALFFNQLFRFAVPLFFLISGFVLMGRYEFEENLSLWSFYKKRLVKLLVPYVVWTGIYYIFVNHNSIAAFFINLPSLLLYGSAADQLYFIPTIILLYTLFPLLLKIVKCYPFTQKAIWYWVLFTGSIILLFLDYYFPHLPLVTPLRISLLNLPLFLIGMITMQYNSQFFLLVKRNSKLIASLLVLTIFILLYEGKALYFNTYTRNSEYFTSQWRPTVFFYSIFLFSLFMSYVSIAKKYEKLIRHIASLTFFVFFIHQIFIHVFWRVWGAYLFSVTIGKIGKTVWFDPLVFAFVIFCSYIFAYFISLIPKVRTLLGISV